MRPENRRVQLEIDVTSRSADGRRWTADGHLWVDGLRIYSAWGLACAVVVEDVPSGPPVSMVGAAHATPATAEHGASRGGAPSIAQVRGSDREAGRPSSEAVAPELAHDRARPFTALPIGTASVHARVDGYRPEPTPVTGLVAADDATAVAIELTTPGFIAEWTEPTVPEALPFTGDLPAVEATGALRAEDTPSSRSIAAQADVPGTHGATGDETGTEGDAEREAVAVATAEHVSPPAQEVVTREQGDAVAGVSRVVVGTQATSPAQEGVTQAGDDAESEPAPVVVAMAASEPASSTAEVDVVAATVSSSAVSLEAAATSVVVPGEAPALPTAWPFAPRDDADRAVRARVGVRLGIVPEKVQFASGRGWATERPLRVFPVHPETHLVGLPRVDLEPVLGWWRARTGVEGWLGEPLMLALLRAFVSDLVLHDPAGLLALRGRPVLLLANHQNYLESALLTTLLAPVLGSPIRSVAKTAHKGAWLDQLANLYTRYPNAPVTERIVWFDPNDRASLVALAQEAVDRPLLVHVEGTRQTEPDQSIEKFSSIWLDLALQRDLPVIPVAFRGGVTGAGTRHEVPPAAQIHHVGAPILPAALAALPHAERRLHVARAIDALGRPEALSDGSVRAPGAAFTAALRTWAPDLLRLASNPPSGPTYAWLRQLQQLLRAGEG